MEKVFDVQDLSEAETDVLISLFSNPLIVKYLKIVAKNSLIELATLSSTERVDSEVAKKHALVQGKISTLVTLLSLSTLKPSVKE